MTTQLRYQAGPDAVWTMLTDRRFLDEVCKQTGAVRHRSDVDVAADGSATITTRRTLPTDDFPEFVRSFVGGTVEVVRTDTWQPPGGDGARDGRIVVEISGAPVRLTGPMTLRGSGPFETLHAVDGDLKASVPLVGGRIEKAVEPPIRSAIAVEERLGNRWLG